MSVRHARLADIVEFSCVDGPGNRFVVFLQGCNLDCVVCHNPQTISVRSGRASEVSVEELVDRIRPLVSYLRGVTVSGGEATLQAPFVREFFAALRSDHELRNLTRFVDSNGCAPLATWERLLPVTDGVMLDLKAIDPATHHLLTGRSNDLVLRSIEHVADAGKLHEVRLLLVPGFNDDPATIERTASWLMTVAPQTNIKLIGFRSHGTLPPAAEWPDADHSAIEAAAAVFAANGFADVVAV